MARRDELLGLIQTLYAAPGSESGWMTFLRELGLSTQCACAQFMSLSSVHRANVAITTLDSPEALATYQQHWGAHDPWGQGSRVLASPGQTVVLGPEIVSHGAFTSTEYYAEFARRYDVCRVAIGIVEREPDGVSVISLNRSEAQSDFDGEDARVLQALMPHLRRGLQLHARLVSSESRTNDLSSVIARMRDALLLVSVAGRVTFMNDAASQLLAVRDGVTMDGCELRASERVATEQLRIAIADACRTSGGDGTGAGGTVLLPRLSGRRPLVAVVSPLSQVHLSAGFFSGEGPSAMVVISDPDAIAAPSEDLLRVLFSLTPAEARLARLLVSGVTLAEAAVQLGVTVETVRKRVKSIFEKTGTSRQAELVALLVTTARR